MGWQTEAFSSHYLFIQLDRESDRIYMGNYLKVTVVSVLGHSVLKIMQCSNITHIC